MTPEVVSQVSEQETSLTPVGGSQFLMNGAPVTFQRPGRDAQFGSNDLVRGTLASRPQNLLLSL